METVGAADREASVRRCECDESTGVTIGQGSFGKGDLPGTVQRRMRSREERKDNGIEKPPYGSNNAQVSIMKVYKERLTRLTRRSRKV